MKRLLALILAGLLLFSGCRSDEPLSEETAAETAEVTTTQPESSVPEYIWTTRTPEETAPEPEGEYTFHGSLYQYSSLLQKALGEDGRKDYMNLVTTILMGTESVRMHSAYADLCVQALYESFPLFWQLESLTFTPDPPEESAETEETIAETEETTAEEEDDAAAAPESEFGVMTIRYRNPEEHQKIIDEFQSAAARMLNQSGAAEAETKDEAAILLYRYVTQNVTDWTGEALSSYGALMGEEAEEEAPEKYPIGGTQAFLLHFLLLQSGLDSTVVTGDLRGNSRVWCAFSLDGKWYHCDPNCEMTDNGGTGLFYFGMTDAYRENEGYTNQSVGCALPEQQAIYRHLNSEGDAMPVDSPALSLTADDDRFAVFRESFYAEVNDQGAAAYYVGAEEAGVYQFH